MQKTKALTIVGVSDENYLPFLNVFILSAARHNPGARIHLHLINVDAEAERQLKSLSPNIEVSVESVSGLSTDEMKAYAANSRVRVLKTLIERGDPYVVYFDADAIFRKSLSRLEVLLKDADILALRQATVHRVTGGDRDRFAAGGIAFKNTPATKAFLEEWESAVRPKQALWFSEQIYFAKTVDRMNGRITLKDLPASFLDWKLYFGSEVWVGKGPVVERPLYRLEASRYAKQPDSSAHLGIFFAQCYYRARFMLWELKNAVLEWVFGTRDRVLGRVPYAEKEDGLQNPPEDVRYKDRPHNAP